ncbi:MAG: hypothetical protein ACREJ3_11255, partial [Polyangiaceae bacterium]
MRLSHAARRGGLNRAPSGGALVASIVIIVLACEAPAVAPQSSAPMNACPPAACSGFAMVEDAGIGGVSCEEGACVVTVPSSRTDDLVMVVAVPEDSSFAPGRTFAVTFRNLFSSASA